MNRGDKQKRRKKEGRKNRSKNMSKNNAYLLGVLIERISLS